MKEELNEEISKLNSKKLNSIVNELNEQDKFVLKEYTIDQIKEMFVEVIVDDFDDLVKEDVERLHDKFCSDNQGRFSLPHPEIGMTITKPQFQFLFNKILNRYEEKNQETNKQKRLFEYAILECHKLKCNNEDLLQKLDKAKIKIGELIINQ